MKPLQLLESGRFLGEEFILWLWRRGLVEGGISGVEGDTSACFVDDAVTLVTERGDVKSLALSKGNPAESREAFDALSRGMRPSKAKVRLLAGDMEWTFTLDAQGLELNALKLPPSQAKDPQSKIADRLFLLEEGLAHMDRRYAEFLTERAQEAEAMAEKLKAWIRQGLTGAPDMDEAPWEDGAASSKEGDRDITVSASFDGGKTYTKPIAMDQFTRAAKDAAGALGG